MSYEDGIKLLSVNNMYGSERMNIHNSCIRRCAEVAAQADAEIAALKAEIESIKEQRCKLMDAVKAYTEHCEFRAQVQGSFGALKDSYTKGMQALLECGE